MFAVCVKMSAIRENVLLLKNSNSSNWESPMLAVLLGIPFTKNCSILYATLQNSGHS